MSNTTVAVDQQIPLVQIRPSQNNPRRIITQEMIDTRAASMAEGGQTTAITLTPLTPAEGEVLYEIIDGELRYRAALKLGWTEIEASIKPMSAGKAYKTRIAANRSHKPIWFEDYLAMEELVNEPEGSEKMQKQQIADLFEVQNSIVTRAMRILKALNVTSRDLVFQNLKNSGEPGQVKENTLYRLTDLEDPTAVETALRVVLDKQMTEPQAKALVLSIKAGTPAHEHVVAPKAPKTAKAPKADAPEAVAPTQAPKAVHTASQQATSSSSASMGAGENAIWDGLAGISIIAQIRAKIKKGERPSLGETLILAIDLLWRGLAWVSKHSWKVAKWLLKETWKSSKATLRMLGAKVLRIAGGVLGFLFLCFVLWFSWDAYEHGILHPFQEIGTLWAITHPSHADSHPHPPSTSAPEGKLESAQPNLGTRPEVSSQAPTISQPAPTVAPTHADSRPHASSVNTSSAKLESAQPNHVAQLEASQQVKKADSLDDLASTVAKQAGPGAAADAAKKIFGL